MESMQTLSSITKYYGRFKKRLQTRESIIFLFTILKIRQNHSAYSLMFPHFFPCFLSLTWRFTKQALLSNLVLVVNVCFMWLPFIYLILFISLRENFYLRLMFVEQMCSVQIKSCFYDLFRERPQGNLYYYH